MDRSPVPPPPAAGRSSGLGLRLAVLFIAALVHRIGIAVMTATISSDSAHYLWCAQTMAAGAYDLAFESFAGIHPLYPLLVAWVSIGTGDVTVAGAVVTILAGSAAVVPLYLLIRSWWNDRVAFWSACLYAADPTFALETADIMTSGLYLVLFLSALAWFVSSLRGGHASHALLAGLAAGGAYLTRPEGILLPVLFVAGALIRAVCLRRTRNGDDREPGAIPTVMRAGITRHALETLAALLVFGVIAGPYVLWIRSVSGHWLLTLRPVHSGLTERVSRDGCSRNDVPVPITMTDPDPDGVRESDPGRHETSVEAARPVQDPLLYSVLKHVGSRLLYPSLAPLLLIGLWTWRRQEGRPSRLALLVALTGACWIPAVIVSAASHYPLSHRYLLPGMLFVLPWMAAGVATVADVLSPRKGTRWRTVLRTVLLSALVLSIGLKTWKPHRWDETAYVEAGRWVASQSDAPGFCRVAASRDKIAYYAGARLVKMPRWDDAAVAAGPVAYAGQLRRIGAAAKMDYLVYDERTMEVISSRFHEILAAEGFVQVARFPPGRGPEGGVIPVRVYRLARETGGRPSG